LPGLANTDTDKIVLTDSESGAADKKLVSGKDYIALTEAMYDSNTNAGTGTITVTGDNNYKGKIVVTFPIAKADFTKSDFVFEGLRPTYDGKAKPITVKMRDGLQGAGGMDPTTPVTYAQISESGSLISSVPAGVGEYSIQLKTTAGALNYNQWDAVVDGVTLVILRAKQTTANFEGMTDRPYTGSPQTVTPTVKTSGGETAASVGTTISTPTYRLNNGASLPNVVAVGTYDVIADVTGGANYEDVWGFTLGQVKVNPIKPVISNFTVTAAGGIVNIYLNSPHTPDSIGAIENVRYENDDGVIYNDYPTDPGDYKVLFDVKAGKNFSAEVDLKTTTKPVVVAAP
jgi:hypothetical protein